jgi:hypothetical protein
MTQGLLVARTTQGLLLYKDIMSQAEPCSDFEVLQPARQLQVSPSIARALLTITSEVSHLAGDDVHLVNKCCRIARVMRCCLITAFPAKLHADSIQTICSERLQLLFT